MNETLGRGYARIEAIRAARGDPPSTVADSEAPHPENYFVYITLLVSGMALLLPFNCFVMAVDFYQQYYPNSTIMYDISTVYISTACVAVVINNMLVYYFSYDTRILFGIFLTVCAMLFVAACNIGWFMISDVVSYDINLVAVSVIAFGCTVQQASYYGFTSCLPLRYTQAVMAGESAAGVLMCSLRIVIKYKVHPPQRSTFIFFLFSISVLLFHCLLHHMMMRSSFTKYYMKITKESRQRRRIQLHLTPNDDVTLMESEVGEASYGVLKLQSPALSTAGQETNTFSFSNPVYSPTAPAPAPAPVSSIPDNEAASPPTALQTPRPSYKVEDVLYDSPDRPSSWRTFKRGVLARWAVTRAIYPYMVSMGLVYFATLSLYPGIASEVSSCRLGSWMPITIISAFNLFDLIGKMAAGWPYEWSRSQLLMASGVRLLLVPLMLLCAAPRHSPHIVGDVYPILFSVIMGFTNGLFGSVPMIMAPFRVGQEYREIAGNVMTLAYNSGLLSGSLVSYLLLGMLGARAAAPCWHYTSPPLPTLPAHTTPAGNLSLFTPTPH